MPLGFTRLNERTQRPNAHINFIKPLATASPADQQFAQDFLDRIAAQCTPIMSQHHISLMALEEFPANREFLGRNFNAGEVIQLVLKDRAGRWLAFEFVQMVMMHELAHCKHMNHGRAFWAERHLYADAMRALWRKGYTGDGLWGRGLSLHIGGAGPDHATQRTEFPEHLCGGTYRRARGIKRKRGLKEVEKPRVSYAERQQKRIARKFGVHGEGNSLGEDELVRGGLERGKRHYSKPKVAQSKRGRDLRASAALARFEQAKKQTPESTPELEDDEGSGSETEDDSDADDVGTFVEGNSPKTIDENGVEMVQVCGSEGEQQDGERTEWDELRSMDAGNGWKSSPRVAKKAVADATPTSLPPNTGEDTKVRPDDEPGETRRVRKPQFSNGLGNSPVATTQPDCCPTAAGPPDFATCSVCSLNNSSDALTCVACSHVLKPSLVPDAWRCRSQACNGSAYTNAGDAGRCGLCGSAKPTGGAIRAAGVIGAEVLRWD